MNITSRVVDKLSIVVKVDVAKEDYSPKVDKMLRDYSNKVSIAGFRKGQVPLGIIKKKYGRATKLEEVNKIIQESLKKYLLEEKIDYLGYPIPKDNDLIGLEQDNLSFEFELGLKPNIKVSVKTKKAVIYYEIIIDKNLIDKQIESMRKRFGMITSKEMISEYLDEITGSFKSEKQEWLMTEGTTIEFSSLKPKAAELFKGRSVGDIIEIEGRKLFNDTRDLALALNIEESKARTLKGKLFFTIQEINHRKLADMNQEFFDKVYGENVLKSEEELREKIDKTLSQKFKNESDQLFLEVFTKKLIENTKFDLPECFLKKWLQQSGEKRLTEEESKDEFEKSEKSLRYQLIESKILSEYKIEPSREELRSFTKSYIAKQMLQLGRTEIKDEEITDIADRVLANQDEVKKLYSQLLSEKLLDLYKANGNVKVKKLSFDDFVKETRSIQ